ncbi:MAG: glutathione S-transferase family protein [Paraglaciecola sp.]|nr:glutathione S-transferase family protein [Paraglaciecola sp.]
MKLFYSPHMASAGPLIAAVESNISIELVSVDIESGKTIDGLKFNSISEKACIPVLERDDGSVLTETSAILLYIASLNGNSSLNNEHNSEAYFRVNEWMSYFSSEIHKFYTLLFWDIDLKAKREVSRRILEKFKFVEKALEGKEFLVGNKFSLADIYLYIVIRGVGLINFDATKFPNVSNFKARFESRPTVQEALARHCV